MATRVFPEWVAPARHALSDMHWLAWRSGRDTEQLRVLGVVCVMEWLAGIGPAPITGRVGKPVDRESAVLEFRAVGAVAVPSLWPMMAEQLGLLEWAPDQLDPVWTDGVYRTLVWLLGLNDAEPPMDLPVRREDGSPMSAEEIYERTVQAQPRLYSLQERRSELRLRCARTAGRSARLVELIADTKRQHRPVREQLYYYPGR